MSDHGVINQIQHEGKCVCVCGLKNKVASCRGTSGSGDNKLGVAQSTEQTRTKLREGGVLLWSVRNAAAGTVYR